MLTKEEKLKLKPVTDKLKDEYFKDTGKYALMPIIGNIEPDFMFWVVDRYEGQINEINKILKSSNT